MLYYSNFIFSAFASGSYDLLMVIMNLLENMVACFSLTSTRSFSLPAMKKYHVLLCYWNMSSLFIFSCDSGEGCGEFALLQFLNVLKYLSFSWKWTAFG